jgi:hypothetical protein
MKLIIHAVLLIVAFMAGIYVGVKYPHHATEIDQVRVEAAAQGKIEVLKHEQANVTGADPASIAKRADYQAQIDAEQAKADGAKTILDQAGVPQP